MNFENKLKFETKFKTHIKLILHTLLDSQLKFYDTILFIYNSYFDNVMINKAKNLKAYFDSMKAEYDKSITTAANTAVKTAN